MKKLYIDVPAKWMKRELCQKKQSFHIMPLMGPGEIKIPTLKISWHCLLKQKSLCFETKQNAKKFSRLCNKKYTITMVSFWPVQVGGVVPEGRVEGAAVHEHGGERVQVQLLAGGGVPLSLPPRARGQELKLRLLHLHRHDHTTIQPLEPTTEPWNPWYSGHIVPV